MVVQFDVGWDEQANTDARYTVHDKMALVGSSFIVIEKYTGEASFGECIM